MENHTAKHFALQLGSLASLYISLSFLLVLLFAIINILVPDATDSSWSIESYYTSARMGIAALVVFFPTYVVLTRFVNKARRDESQGAYLGLTKWLIYLSLLVGGGVLLGDLVAVIMAFLEGEITLRFILKALAVLVVVGAAFGYYAFDAKGYWLEHHGRSYMFGLVATCLVTLTVVGGFFAIEGPSTARERALDEEQVRDLQQIQSGIQDYLLQNDELPASQADLPNNRFDFSAPGERPDYTYQTTEEGFRLCATFATTARENDRAYARPLTPPGSDQPIIEDGNDWSYEPGEYCFARTVVLPEAEATDTE